MLRLFMTETTNNFQDFDCNNCGWCCQRTPCPVGLYLGQAPMKACEFLKETNTNEYKCGLLLEEKDPIKFEALKSILLAGKGCSHIYGPHPVSLMRELLAKGLKPDSDYWKMAKVNTINEYTKMTRDSLDPESILQAIEEFKMFCQECE